MAEPAFSNRHSVSRIPHHDSLPPLLTLTPATPPRPPRSKTPPQRFQSTKADTLGTLSPEKESSRRSKLGALRDALGMPFKSQTLRLSSLKKKTAPDPAAEPLSRPVSMALPTEHLSVNVTTRSRPRSALYTSIMAEGLLGSSINADSKGCLGDCTVGEVLGMGMGQDDVITSPLYMAGGHINLSPIPISMHSSSIHSTNSGINTRARCSMLSSKSPKAIGTPNSIATQSMGFNEFENMDLLGTPCSPITPNTLNTPITPNTHNSSSAGDWQEFTTAEAYEQHQASLSLCTNDLPRETAVTTTEHVCDLSAEAEAEAEEQGAVLRTIEGAGVAGLVLTRTLFALLLRYSELLAEGSVMALQSILPLSLHKYVQQIAPFMRYAILIAEILLACCLVLLELCAEAIYMLHRALKPYHPGMLVLAAAGLVVCFFGGFFALTIAAVEAFCLCGYQTTLLSLRHIAEDIQAYLLKSRPISEYTASSKEGSGKEEDVAAGSTVESEGSPEDDINASSKPRVHMLDSRGYILQQLYMLLVHIDPHRLSEALIGLNSGAVAVLTTLKLQFAKTITLGQAIAQSLQPVASIYGPQLLNRLLPEELHKWSPFVCRYGLKLLAISVAWRLRRVIASYHSALRGGSLCSKYVAKYLVAMKVLPRAAIKRYSTVILLWGYALALAGLYMQYSAAYQLPYPLNMLLFPVTVVESCLLWVVNHSVYLPALGVV
ncbi:hypothetical protein EON64_07300 [archaeon]|nr:MAG: hypothetical protein EON64_07300 [archaeon]